MNQFVTKRDGTKVPLNLDKIMKRIEKQTYSLDLNYVKPFEVAQKVIQGITDGIQTRELDNLAMETAAMLTTKHPDYAKLAARLAISALHKETDKNFSNVVKELYEYFDEKSNRNTPVINKDFYDFVMKNKKILNATINHDKDYEYDYFGYKVLEKSYLLKKNGVIIERPQYMVMRTAIQVSRFDLDTAIENYKILSDGLYTHATPTLFNSGTINNQLSSCFLLNLESDSIDGIFNTLKETALISKNAGGIGLAFSGVRGKGTYIKGTNGTSNGIIPFLKIYNETARAVDQGGGRRKGSFAVYLETWHSEIIEFLDLKKNQGKDEIRARDLFLALWMNDLFMERVKLDADWSLMCPHECPGLIESYGDEFEKLYTSYEKNNKFKKKIKARELWTAILDAQIETGVPYILYKDAINSKNNQDNLGVIKSSNLCAEIVEFSGVSYVQKELLQNKEQLEKLNLGEFYGRDEVNEAAVCNLASINLTKMVVLVNGVYVYDFNKLYETAYRATVNLNNVIDINYYPTEQTKFSNLVHRPIGLGVQGLADVFFLLQLPYSSEEAKQLNKDIFETIYYAAIKASNDVAKVDGIYYSYNGSPASKGKLQFDLWGVTPSDRWDWVSLKQDIEKYGLRNSLTTCVMPTASSSSILGNEASIEAQTSNLYVRRVLSGEYVMINKYLVRDLIKLNLWNEDVRTSIIRDNGSILNIPSIPNNIKEIYRTVWEIKQKDVIQMSADRSAFIDQTQSLNIFMQSPDHEKLTVMHFYGWGLRSFAKDENNNIILPEGDGYKIYYDNFGNPMYYRHISTNLKTGMYYLRSKSAANAIKFTLEQKKEPIPTPTPQPTEEEILACSIDNPDDCVLCSS